MKRVAVGVAMTQTSQPARWASSTRVCTSRAGGAAQTITYSVRRATSCDCQSVGELAQVIADDGGSMQDVGDQRSARGTQTHLLGSELLGGQDQPDGLAVLPGLPVRRGHVDQVMGAALRHRQARHAYPPGVLERLSRLAQLDRNRDGMNGDVRRPERRPEVVAVRIETVRGAPGLMKQVDRSTAVATTSRGDGALQIQRPEHRQA